MRMELLNLATKTKSKLTLDSDSLATKFEDSMFLPDWYKPLDYETKINALTRVMIRVSNEEFKGKWTFSNLIKFLKIFHNAALKEAERLGKN